MSTPQGLPAEIELLIPESLEAALAVVSNGPEDFCKAIGYIASDLKASRIVGFDVREIVSFTDVFLVITANSQTHIRAISERIERELKGTKVRPERIDGARGSSWVVMDFSDVIVHIMTEDARKFFDLERLWGDAPRWLLDSSVS
jgi:ribosome-associated protein